MLDRDERFPLQPSGGVKAGEMDNREPSPLPPAVEDALDGIELRLRQMLALARLSASDSDVDRTALQRRVERLRREIDRIADQLEDSQT